MMTVILLNKPDMTAEMQNDIIMIRFSTPFDNLRIARPITFERPTFKSDWVKISIPTIKKIISFVKPDSAFGNVEIPNRTQSTQPVIETHAGGSLLIQNVTIISPKIMSAIIPGSTCIDIIDVFPFTSSGVESKVCFFAFRPRKLVMCLKRTFRRESHRYCFGFYEI